MRLPLVARLTRRPAPVHLIPAVGTDREALAQRVQELEVQRNQAQAALNSMAEGVVALDRRSRVLWLNESAQRTFGINASVAIGKRLVEVFHHPDVELLLNEALAQRRSVTQEVQLSTPDEQVCQVRVTPCEGGPDGTAAVLIVHDVTEVRRLERVRREFVANVSHELKTPLTSITGLVETLLNGALDDSANNRRFVGLIQEDTARLTRLIDDLLQLSQIESRTVPLKIQPTSLKALLESVTSWLQVEIARRRLAVDVQVAPGLSVRADPERLRQVFANLLDNAVKYNIDGGRISVKAEARHYDLIVTITDTGIGIPAEDAPRIFERFYRVDKARSRALGGTGLGLSIVKHLVEAHGGTVSVESQPGRGSTFTVQLPLRPV